MTAVTVAVVAKECLPGRVKTRLIPALGPEGAARVAAASLSDTLATVRALPAARRILFFDGEVVPAAAEGFHVLPQPTGDLDERLGTLFDAVQGPLLLVGMDTPQVRPADVAAVFEQPERDAWFGPAEDGGFWALYLHVPDGALIRGVPMSKDDTGAVQRARLVDAGLDVGDLAPLLDVDEIADADRVAELAPDSAFAAALASERTTSGGAR
ncbi:TIGR04282 family arsenosugar biosynthesis glycosyltransferase [Curtobacterium sp. SP.BCp]|uniref:TIGR04282 family arsenosugar biosynthesis glycosyltransferase n=1 Tax=Curtobacterium sp. SP.BCp TaxID=3435230 RepID=UPI003F7330A8